MQSEKEVPVKTIFRIKPLLWTICVSYHRACYSANTGEPVSDWYNVYADDDDKWYFTCGAFAYGYKQGGTETFNECANLAQKHYRRRLIPALEQVEEP